MKILQNNNPLIVALDVSSREEVTHYVDAIGDAVGMYKIGLELFTRFGPSCVQDVTERGYDVMLDLKFHDIPATVERAVRNALMPGVSLMTLHASGGRAMMAAARTARDESGSTARLLGVTVLTSIDAATFVNDLRLDGTLTAHVQHLARCAQDAGLDGVVASPQEIHCIREVCGDDFLIVTPGIRPAGAATHDQKRVCTPADACAAGANYLVIGRPITRAENPRMAAEEIYRSCSIS